ncbi:MAG: DNRLRE domain-containing protein, partial [Rubrivirga sp.]
MMRLLFVLVLLPVAAAQPSVTLEAIGDAYVRAGTHADTNYGSSPQLRVKDSATDRFTRQAFLRFAVGGADRAAVARATLRLWCADRPNTEPAPISAYQVERLLENDVTYATRPAIKSGVEDRTVVTACGRWYEWDVTDLVRREGGARTSIGLVQDAGANRLVTFSSREGSRPPELVLDYGPASGGPDFVALATAYADEMVANGRFLDDAGAIPLFSTMIDRETMDLFADPEGTVGADRNEIGARTHERAWNAANLDDDHALHELLYALTAGTGNASYAAAADAALGWYARNTAFDTGLIPWGEHAAWRIDTESTTRHDNPWGDLKHELQLGMTGLWSELFALAPEAMEAYARGTWEEHVYDKENVVWAHQTHLDGSGADRGFVFARTAGHMVSVWAHAYAASTDAAVRTEMAGYIEAVAVAHNGRRDARTDAVTQWWKTPPPNAALDVLGGEVGHSTFNDMRGVVDVQRAVDLDVLPAATENLLRDWVGRSTATFHAVAHPFATGGVGFYNRVSLADLSPDNPVAGTEPWCQAYGKIGPVVSGAVTALQRYEQSGDVRFLDLAAAAADWYAEQGEPECDVAFASDPLPLWPDPVASAIELFLGVHAATGEALHLDHAERLGAFAVREFLDDVSALPRVFAATGNASGFDHYEGHMGGPALMLSLYRLGLALEDASGLEAAPT